VNVRHGEDLAERFRSRDVPAPQFQGPATLKAKNERKILEAFEAGELDVLCAC